LGNSCSCSNSWSMHTQRKLRVPQGFLPFLEKASSVLVFQYKQGQKTEPYSLIHSFGPFYPCMIKAQRMVTTSHIWSLGKVVKLTH
jgi:predicted N-formylglutamate amidohydrolase